MPEGEFTEWVRTGGGGGAPTGPVAVVGLELALGPLPALGLLPLAEGLLPVAAAAFSPTASLKASAIEPGAVDGDEGARDGTGGRVPLPGNVERRGGTGRVGTGGGPEMV